MTIIWTKVIPHDQAAHRVGGRTRINAQRHREAERRRGHVVRMVDVYGLEHGVRQRIANELGVHRSTISRDIKVAILRAPRNAPADPSRASQRVDSEAGTPWSATRG